MNKKKSLEILNKCIDEIKNMSQEEFDKRIENGKTKQLIDGRTLIASEYCGWDFAEECEYYLEDEKCGCPDLCGHIILIEP